MKKNYMTPTAETTLLSTTSMVCASVRLSLETGETPETDSEGTIWMGSRGTSIWDDDEEG